MNENEITAVEANQQANLPVQYQGEPPVHNEARGEWVKFGALVVIFLITFAVIALVAPVVGQIIPTVLGLDSALDSAAAPSQPAPGDTEPIDDSSRNGGDQGLDSSGGELNGNGGTNDQSGNNNGNGVEEEVVTPTATPRTHVVQASQNLTVIARQYGVTVEAIIQANNLTNPNRIEAGMILIIP